MQAHHRRASRPLAKWINCINCRLMIDSLTDQGMRPITSRYTSVSGTPNRGCQPSDRPRADLKSALCHSGTCSKTRGETFFH